jgi:translation initiation factor IF-1
MVKNLGGNKAKSFARKNEKPNTSNRLRMSECDEEKYAVVRKIYGGCMCEIYCDDLKYRKGIIRGKFRGKGKRNNIIGPGTVVLVGIRDWASETASDKLEQSDILEVYSALELDQLKQKPKFPTDFLESSMREMFGNSSSSDRNDEFIFTTVEDNLSSSLADASASSELTNTFETGEQVINIDDI